MAKHAQGLAGIGKKLEALQMLDKPFLITLELTVKPERAAEFESVAQRVEALTQAEGPGCELYVFSKSLSKPNSYLLNERFSSFAALEYHFSKEHTTDILDAFEDMLVTRQVIVSAPI